MDALIELITIAAFIIAAIKKAQEKAMENAKKFEQPKAAPPQPQQQARPKSAVNQNAQRTTRSMEYSKGEMGKKLPKEKLVRPEFVSTEGMASQEGQCIEPNANHCAVEHFEDTVYDSEISDKVPVKFDREYLVQGIIMAEILKPKWTE